MSTEVNVITTLEDDMLYLCSRYEDQIIDLVLQKANSEIDDSAYDLKTNMIKAKHEFYKDMLYERKINRVKQGKESMFSKEYDTYECIDDTGKVVISEIYRVR